LQDIFSLRLTTVRFHKFKARFDSLIFIKSINYTIMACAHPQHGGADKGITRKSKNHEASWSTWKV